MNNNDKEKQKEYKYNLKEERRCFNHFIKTGKVIEPVPYDVYLKVKFQKSLNKYLNGNHWLDNIAKHLKIENKIGKPIQYPVIVSSDDQEDKK